ncbi:conserved hypothetical protein [delta proteobacterium NaphS2]|nr:conserved hypothetical protein [delta proteobacterium NaphS2]
MLFIVADNTPGTPPAPLIENSDIEVLCEDAKASRANEFSSAQSAVAGLRESIFHESVYWLHKSIHSLGAAERKVQNGMLTWSVIDAYLSAFFSMRCLCGMLGVVICDYKNKSYVIDLCRNVGNMRRQIRNLRDAFEEKPIAYTTGVRFDHKQCWEIMQRLLRVLKEESWGKDLSQKIIDLDSKDFAHHRNRICYYAHEWLENDLHLPRYEDDFMSLRNIEFDKATSRFTISLALAMVRAAIAGYWDIAKIASILNEESKLIIASLDDTRHPYFGEQLISFLTTTEFEIRD